MRFARKVQKYDDAFSKSSSIFFNTKGTSDPGPYTQRQTKECKVLQEKSFKKDCQIVTNTSIEDGYLWYLFFTLQGRKSQGRKYDIFFERTGYPVRLFSRASTIFS